MTSPKKRPYWVLTPLGLGIAFFILGFISLRSEHRQTTEFISTEGTITRTWVEEHRGRANHRARNEGPNHRVGKDTFEPRVEYRYFANNRNFTGDRIANTTFSQSSQIAAHAMLAQWSVGDKVTVWYDPNQPADSLLKLKFSLLTTGICALGSLLIVASAAGMGLLVGKVGARGIMLLGVGLSGWVAYSYVAMTGRLFHLGTLVSIVVTLVLALVWIGVVNGSIKGSVRDKPLTEGTEAGEEVTPPPAP